MAGSPMNFNDCVSKGELTAFITKQRNLMNELTRNVTNLVIVVMMKIQMENYLIMKKWTMTGDARNRCHNNFNRCGMGGNNHGNNDPFAKIKFSLPPFACNVDPEAYLDWELALQQKFNSHNVPAEHRVRLATSEFTNFALF